MWHLVCAAGDSYDIAFNTILATDELNLLVRGTPCREMRFHDNLLLRPQSASVKTHTKFPNCGSGFPRHCDDNNHYSSPDPTNDLAVGDFDGDGVDDIFVGTGVACTSRRRPGRVAVSSTACRSRRPTLVRRLRWRRTHGHHGAP